MADGAADRAAELNGAGGDTRLDHGGLGAGAEPGRRWPVSAVCTVAVLSVLVIILGLMNLFGLQLGRDGQYDSEIGGSVAEWFGAIATLVALPAAVLFGVRQLQSSGEAIQLGRRQLEADQAERAERRSIELAALRSTLRVRVEVTNIVDGAALATEAELAAVARWRHEYSQRGWVADATASTWRQGSAERSNVEQLTAEASPLVPEPWFAAVECRNTGPTAVVVQRWNIMVNGTSRSVDTPEDLAPGETFRRRLGPEVGLAPAYADLSDARASAALATVVLEASDNAGRRVRIIHPPPE